MLAVTGDKKKCTIQLFPSRNLNVARDLGLIQSYYLKSNF